MPIQIDWFNQEHTIISARFMGKWNRHSYTMLIDIAKSMIETVEHHVHLIFDFSQSQSAPRDLLVGMQYANKQILPNQGLTVYINANSVILAYVLMAKRTGLPLASRIFYAESKDAALQILNKKVNPTQTG